MEGGQHQAEPDDLWERPDIFMCTIYQTIRKNKIRQPNIETILTKWQYSVYVQHYVIILDFNKILQYMPIICWSVVQI